MKSASQTNFDAIVIGTGLTGMYAIYRLRQQGLAVRGIEKNNDVGGTWNMNRYPGCRLDSESYTYAYSFMHDLLQEWNWTEEFAAQPALNEFFSRAADKMDIRKDIQFNTRVVKASFDEQCNYWEVELDNAEVLTCRLLVTCVGILSNPIMPKFAHMDLFRGESYHSYYWPHEQNAFGGKKVDFAGKKVGVIGTGATGIQIITEVAKTAGELYVFQRNPNWCAPLGNRPIDAQGMADIKQRYPEIFATCEASIAGFKHQFQYENTQQHSREQIEAILEGLYWQAGFGIWIGHFASLFSDRQTNDLVSQFVANKIRSRIKDPGIAEKLIPKDHGFGLKRVPMESGYYEVYNQPNVHLVDIKQSPIQEMTETGIRTSYRHYDLDIIIYATGFNAIVGGLKEMDIKGRGGKTLKEAWADGPVTYLGLQIPEFPNLFTVLGVHNGATFCNVPRCAETQVNWLTSLVQHLQKNKVETVEADPLAAEKWTQHVYDVVRDSLFPSYTHSYFWSDFGQRGQSKERFLFYFGGNPRYRQICSDVAAKGYEGFIMHTRAAQLAAAG